MSKEIKVQMTLEWTFNKKDWSDEQKHLDELEKETESVLGYDAMYSLFMLNDITTPEAKRIRVTPC